MLSNYPVAIAKKPVVSLYSNPSFSVLSDEILYGMPLVILKEQDNFAQVITFYGYEGFVSTDCYNKLKIYTKLNNISNNINIKSNYSLNFAKFCLDSCKAKFVVSKNFIDVLTQPKMQSEIITNLPRGAFVNIISRPNTDGFLQIRLVDGKMGYIKSSQIEDTANFNIILNKLNSAQKDEIRNKICEEALNYIKTQYRWGGKTHFGIDCSGLAFTAYLKCGIIIYRDAKLHNNYPLKQIEFANAMRGDLLYFPGHVAIYLGEGEFIHSTAHNGSEGVVINSFNKFSHNYRQDLHNSLLACASVF